MPVGDGGQPVELEHHRVGLAVRETGDTVERADVRPVPASGRSGPWLVDIAIWNWNIF
jgi:hypothetical protein